MPNLLKRYPYQRLIEKIRAGTLADDIEYSSLNRQDFIETLGYPENSKCLVQKKYDGWLGFVTPDGIYSKTGCLKTDLIKTSGRTLLVGEYLVGTQWSKNHAEYGRVIVFESSEKDAELPSMCRWIESYTPVQALRRLDDLLLGFEGLILKDPDTGDFVRYKKDFTGDYVIISCISSDAKTLAGWACSSIEVGLYFDGKLKSVMTVSGIEHSVKADMHDHPEKYCGQVVEVSGKALFQSGCLRHPAFMRIREDKKPEQCTMKQFKGVLK